MTLSRSDNSATPSLYHECFQRDIVRERCAIISHAHQSSLYPGAIARFPRSSSLNSFPVGSSSNPRTAWILQIGGRPHDPLVVAQLVSQEANLWCDEPTGRPGRRIKREREKIRHQEGKRVRMRALGLVHHVAAARCGASKEGRQRTRNYRRGYIPALSLPSRAVVTSRLHSPAARERTDIRVMTFSAAALKIVPRSAASPLVLTSSRPALICSAVRPPSRPLKSPYRPTKSGDYPRTIVPLFTSRRGLPRRIRR